MSRLTRAAFLKAGATAAAGVLAACGPVPSEAPEQAAAEPVAVQYWFTDSPPWAQIRTDLVARFTQQQREVRVEPVIKTIDQAVDAAVAAGTPPDVADIYTFDVVPRWTRNALVDLAGQGDRAWATNHVKGLPPFMADAVTVDGKVAAMPYSAQAWVFYFNKALLRGAGLPEPQAGWTWTDWLETMRKVTKHADDPEQGVFGHWVFYFPNISRSLLRTMDADFLSADGARVTVDTAQALEAVQFVADLIHRHRVAPANPLRPQREVLFNAGKVLFTDDAAQKPAWAKNGLAVGATHWPVHPTVKKRAQAVSHNNVAVYRQSDPRKVAAAQTFLRWWVAPPQVATYARLGGNLPVHRAAAELPEWATFARSDPYARFEADEVARYGYAGVPKLPAANKALAAINAELGNDVRDGKVAVKEALLKAEQAAVVALRGG